ncbi:MAG: glycosyltransferase [Kiritimatiellia bacterium]
MTVKIVSKNPLFGQAPFEYAPGYVFTQDPACTAYDWLVVFDDLRDSETVTCPKERTILATWEPVSIKNYCSAFTRQFGHLLTNRPPQAENHPHYHLGKGYFPWCNGRSYAENKAFALPPKTQAVSAVCSAKAMKWTKHYERIRLLKQLVAEVPGAVWYGHGIHEFKHKFDLLDSFRYHVVLENHIGAHYWTEKIADAYLGECLPFYAGAPDLAEDFPAESFIPIPMDDPGEAIRIIREAIAHDEWARRLSAIREAKARLFSEYNFWAQVIKVIEAEKAQRLGAVGPAQPYVIRSRKWLRRRTLAANLEDGWFHCKQYLSGVGLWPKLS